MEKESIFNTKLLEEKLKELGKHKPEYFIGIDTYDAENLAYCMVMKHGKSSTIIQLKKMVDRVTFDEEVANLAKYFDAVIIKEMD